MKTYTKIHRSIKAANIHLAKIKKRGGIATTKMVAGGIQIDYYFPTEQSTADNKKKYDILSPEGKTIRKGVPPFESIMEMRQYFEKWKMQFARTGYWSPEKGLIPLANLAYHCKWISLK